MVNYERIIKDCFWDSKLEAVDLEKIVKNSDQRELEKLFSKIIYNSSDKLQALQIFPKERLKLYFSKFQATYNEKYINKHLQILKYLLFGEKHEIKGLEWKKR